MKQFRIILNFELKHYIKNKAFVGITLALVCVIALVIFFPRLKATFGNEKGEDLPEELPLMLVRAEKEEDGALVRELFAAAFPGYSIELTGEEDTAIRERITSGQAECAVVLTGPTSYRYYVNNLSMYDTNTALADEVLQNLYRLNAMVAEGLSPEEAEAILSAPIEHEITNLGKDQMQNFFYTYIMIFALYMVILLYGQMVASNVASEKNSRAMELLITSARPVGMMFGKVIASCLAGLVQLLAIFGSAFVFFNLNRSYWEGNAIISSIFDVPLNLLGYMLLFFVLGFFIYAFLYGAIGSTVSKVEDVNVAVMPLTFLFIAAFLVVMVSMGSGSVDNTAMVVCSYIPFTSPMAMFTRIAMSTVPVYEILLSVAVLIGSVVGIGVLSAKIYRVGVLLYGNAPSLGAIFKAIRKA